MKTRTAESGFGLGRRPDRSGELPASREGDCMLKFPAHLFIQAINNLADFEADLVDPQCGLDEEGKQALLSIVDELIGQTRLFHLPMSLKKAQWLAIYLRQSHSDHGAYLRLLDKTIGELKARLEDELESKAIYVIP